MHLNRLRTDLRDAWRGLWSAPGVTIAALTVLTLGIGASTAIYSVVDAVALRGLPFADDSRLMAVSETDLRNGRPITVAPQNYVEWRARQDVFEHLAAGASGLRLVTIDRPVESVAAYQVTASLFDVLRVAPAMGRPLFARDEHIDAARVAVISDRLWRRRFGADPAILGRTVAFATGTYEIVGVMPPEFTYPVSRTGTSVVDLWVPFVLTPKFSTRSGGRTYLLSVVGRLRPEITMDSASARMTQIRDALAQEHPTWFQDRGVMVRSLRESIVSQSVRSWMVFLLAAVLFVLLIACLNVANLLLARTNARGRELAVRAALGATRWNISRVLITESLMLALLGTIGGVLLALWGVEILRTSLPGNVPRLATAAVDLRVLTVAAITALSTGILFGTIPALRASRPDVIRLLRAGGRPHTGAGHSVRTVLVVAEVALAMMLLVGASLFIASFARVATTDLGFDPKRVMSVWIGDALISSELFKPPATAAARTEVASARAQLFMVLERTRAIPGIVAVSPLIGGLALTGNSVTLPIQHADRLTPPFTDDDEPYVHGVGPEYLDVMSAQLLRGRWVRADDTDGAPLVVVLSDEAVRRYFGDRDPIGRDILLDGVPRTVVGVVKSMRLRGPELPAYREAFVPYLQTTQTSAQLVVRTAPPGGPIAPALQAAVREVMPGKVAEEPLPLERTFEAMLAERRFNMIVIALFGGLAALVAAIGVYGLMAFVVAQRTREIGVRVALGAVPRGILRLVLGRAASLLLIGLAIGLAGAAALEQFVRVFLFNARPHDPALYVAVAVVLLGAGLIAAYGPARRAARVDPLVALRAE